MFSVRKVGLAAILGAALSLGASVFAGADITNPLWYNGDLDNQNGLANELNTAVTDSRIVDDFDVTDDAGWSVTCAWTNNQMNFLATTAEWSIRQDVMSGSGGTVVAMGVSPCTQTWTGRFFGSFAEFTILVDLTDAAIFLPPGKYWLQVTPIGTGNTTTRSFVSTTSGLNSIGSPAGNNGNAFIDSRQFNFNWALTTTVAPNTRDFSMGVGGTVGGGELFGGSIGAGYEAPEAGPTQASPVSSSYVIR